MTTHERVLWAIDPFEIATRPDPSLIQKLLYDLGSSNFELQPVYVTPLPTGQGIDDYVAHGDEARFITDIQKICDRYLQLMGIDGACPTKIIITGASSKSEAIQNLLEYADEIKSPWIMVSTHGRSGMQRIFLGSFAEKLLHQSKLPVLILTHLTAANRSEKPIKRVLFPTDFSDRSRQAFLDFLTLSRRFDFELTLFHTVPLVAQSNAGPHPAYTRYPDTYFKDQEERARGEGGKWAELAQSKGVEARFIMKEEKTVSSVGESILEVAQQQRIDLIAMASLSGAFTSFVAGSVTRDVIRANRYPIWVYGPKF